MRSYIYLTAHEAVVVPVVLVTEVLVEGEQESLHLLLGILHHLAVLVLGQVLHESTFQGEPDRPG